MKKRPAPNAIGGMSFKVWKYYTPMSIRNPQAFVSGSSQLKTTSGYSIAPAGFSDAGY